MHLPTDWQTAWLARTLPLLRWYSNFTFYVILVSPVLQGIIAIVRSRQKDANDSSKGSAISSFRKGAFAIAVINILQRLIIMLLDMGIRFQTLIEDAQTETDSPTAQAITGAAIYFCYEVVISVATIILVPLPQMWAMFRLMPYESRLHEQHLAETKFFMTQVAAIWAMLLLYLELAWAPAVSSLGREVLLLACTASAIVWLGAASVPNFRWFVWRIRSPSSQ